MDVNSAYLCVLVIGLLFDSVYSALSPCPGVLDFYREEDIGPVYGRITVEPERTVSSLEIMINYTILNEQGLDEYLGKIDVPEVSDVVSQYNRGETVHYRIHLPLVNPWPKVTAIIINGKSICTGPGDKLEPNKILSTPSISRIDRHYGAVVPQSFGIFQEELQAKPQPIRQHSSFYTPYVDSYPEQTTIARPRTTTARPRTTTTRPRTTTPVYEYVEPVTHKPRPDQRISNTPTTTIGCGLVGGETEITPLIHNGFSYDRGEVPWLVAIYKATKSSTSVICGGTLVSDRHVITAAHCMYLRTLTSTEEIFLRVGVHRLSDWSSDNLSVIKTPMAADIHPLYSNTTLENDIMILTLATRVTFNNFIRPACLWSGNTDLSQIVGSIGLVAGWGTRNQFNSYTLDEPQKVRVPIVSTNECRASNTIFHKLTSDKTLCAGSKNGDGPCQGDSGGGLYLRDGGKWRLRGVVSKSLSSDGSTPCNLNEYVLYTDTAQYLTWIRKILEKPLYD